MQRPESRESFDEEGSGVGPSVRDRFAVKPEKNEAGKRKEEIDRSPGVIVERLEEPVERLVGWFPVRQPDTGESEEVLPVPEDDRESRKPSQGIERVETLHLRSGFRRICVPDVPYESPA